MKRALFATFAATLALTFLVGCDSGGIKRCPVSGTVSVDGKPVESGSITFHPKTGTASPVVGAVIENGKFEIAKKDGPAPGEFVLDVSGSMKTGNQIDVPGSGGQKMDELKQAIPAKNAYPLGEDVPTATIKAGPNQIDIQLTSEEK